jgi:hypothetical protein
MWEHLSEGEAAAAERRVAEVEYPFVGFGDEPGLGWFFVDGEEMAEYGVDRQLRDLVPALRTCGVELRIERVNEPAGVEDGDYVVMINSRLCVVWRPEDWAGYFAWKAATVRPLAVINDLLAEAGATKRLFTLYPGANEGIAWLLDPRIVGAIADSGLIQKDIELPALATHDRASAEPDARQQVPLDQRWVQLARTLRSLGMWEYSSQAQAEAAERSVAGGIYPFVSFGEDPGVRWFPVDGEEMAGGGVDRVLSAMAPALRTLGVELRYQAVTEPAEVGKGEYVVAINGRHCVVWRQEDWATHFAWGEATVRPLAVINDLLAEAGATKRLFTLYPSGHATVAWLLDPRIVAAVADSGLVQGYKVPALATHG